MDPFCQHDLKDGPGDAVHCPKCGRFGRMVDGWARWEFRIQTHRYAFRGGYYATAEEIPSGRPIVCTGVFFGKGGKAKAIAAALHEARTGNPAAYDTGCPG